MGAHAGQSLQDIGSELNETWQQRLDRAASSPLAYAARLAVLGAQDAMTDYAAVATATGFFWDTGDFSNARALARDWRLRVQELTQDWSADDALEPRVRALVLHARLEFRASEYTRAYGWNEAALRQLRLRVGGDAALRRIIARSESTQAGKLYCTILASQIPVLRMHRSNWPTTVQTHDLYIHDALSIIEHMPGYDRLPALVTQTFFALAARGDHCDGETVDWLAKVDRQRRPGHPRAQATRRLVDMALAKFHGDVAGELAAAIDAERDLRNAGLYGHIRTLNRRGWWKLRPAA
jgi:hypothetical protein